MEEYDREDWFDAIVKGQLSLVNDLINAGWDVNMIDLGGGNALHRVTTNYSKNNYKKIEIMKMLLTTNINMELIDKRTNTPLLNSLLGNKDLKFAHLLIDNGANVHYKNSWDMNALSYAVLKTDKYMTDKLLDMNLSINQRNNKGETFAEIALGVNNKSEVLRFLTEYKSLLNDAQKRVIEKEKLRMLFH